MIPSDSSRSSYWYREPSTFETVAIGVATMVLAVTIVSALGGFWARVPSFGDNGPFILYAGKIVRGDLSGITPQQLFGYPYFGAAVSLLTPFGVSVSLLIVCWTAAIGGLWLCHRLYGGWVASFFAVSSVDWLQHAILGGAQSLALALTYGSFLLARKERWELSALLAAVCTIVRPEGAFALVALGVALLLRRKFRTLLYCVLIGMAIGIVYATPMYLAYGDPFVNYHTYNQVAFPESLLSWPFAGMIRALQTTTTPLSHQILIGFWMLVLATGVLAMVKAPHYRRHARTYPYEALYVVIVIAFYVFYNSIFAFHQFVRFTLTVVPIAYFAMLPWLPKDKRLVYAAGVLMPLFAGASAMNVRRSLAIVHGWLLR